MGTLRVTIDRNILLAVLKDESGSNDIRQIFKAHEDGLISVGLSSANRVEVGHEGKYAQPEEELFAECRQAGLFSPELIDYPLDWDMGLWEVGCTGEEAYSLELKIHAILFPNHPSSFSDQQEPRLRRKVRNVRCDVFAIWGHIHSSRDYFVTLDKRFHRRKDLLGEVGARGIVTPSELVEKICGS